MISRRQLGRLGTGLLLPGMGLPTVARAQSSGGTGRRRFIFLFSDGGWDTSHVFTPFWDIPGAFMDRESAPGSASGIDFVDHPTRPSVRRFFEDFGHQAAVLQGLEVRSVTHERCRELILTGGGGLRDDWAAVLAANGGDELLIPHLILDGPAFTDRYTANAVRVGDDGQLPELLSGDGLRRADLSVAPLPDAVTAHTNAYLAQRVGAGTSSLHTAYGAALERLDGLRGFSELSLAVEDAGCERDIAADCALAFDLFSQDLSRCAMLRYKGWCSEGWDTHQGLGLQSRNFEDLFAYLHRAMTDLAGRTSSSGGPLSEEVVFVVFSEMARDPRLNSWGGRDHWTFTSAMLVGAGIQGGQVIGGLDTVGRGLPVDLTSGEPTASGTALLPDHLGATLLALGDVDPGEYIRDAAPITAVLS